MDFRRLLAYTGAMHTITNLDAASRQLTTAVRMFFTDGDAVSVHTLACAAREIFEQHCRKQGIARTFDAVREANPSYTESQLWKLLHGPRNFFKHPSDDAADEIEFGDELNDFMLLAACNDCSKLCGVDKPIEVEAYLVWFMAVHQYDESTPEPDPADLAMADEFMRVLDARYPGVRSAPRDEQKRFGQSLIGEVQALWEQHEAELRATFAAMNGQAAS